MGRSPHIYGKVACRVHRDEVFRALPRDARLLWLTLLTSEIAVTGPPGLWCAGDVVMLDELADFTPAELAKYRDKLIEAGMLRHEGRLWWRLNSVRAEYNTPDNWQAAVSWARKIASFERGPLIAAYLRRILAEAERWPDRCREAFVSTLRECGADLDTVTERYANRTGTVSVPPAGAGAGAGAYSDPQCLNGSTPADAGGGGKRDRRKKGISVDTVLHEVERVAPSAYVYSPANKGQSIALTRLIGKHPDLGQWTLLGQYLAAARSGRGGEPLGTPLLITQIPDLMAKSKRWDEAKRPALYRGPRGGAPVTDDDRPELRTFRRPQEPGQ